jgi:hypothetical protein
MRCGTNEYPSVLVWPLRRREQQLQQNRAQAQPVGKHGLFRDLIVQKGRSGSTDRPDSPQPRGKVEE